MQDRTNHNRLADQMAARIRAEFVETRVDELAAFEQRASGKAPRKPKRERAVKAAPVETAVFTVAEASIVTPSQSASAFPSQQPAAATVAIEGVTPMSIFQAAESTSAFLKMGVMGKQGAGKSMTAGLLAIGLAKHLKELGLTYASKPVAYFDTEKGSDWLIPVFKKEGIPLVVAKKRSFADLIAAMKWAQENASVLIIDSITHPWRELQESYMKKKQRSFLQVDDWSYLKGQHGWAQFTDLYINSPLHIIMAGRAGDETEQYTDENGKRQFEKVGVKMKTETDTGFEPDLLVLMERDMDLRSKQVAHVARVVKDRSMLLDGKDFTFASYDVEGNTLPVPVLVKQTFAAFMPHINCLNLGGAHIGVHTDGDSTHILKTEKRDWAPVQREICIDEIQTLLALHYPSQSAEDKKNKLKALLTHFDATWTEIEKVMPLPDLRAGYDSLHQALEGRPSKYAGQIERQVLDVKDISIDDALPAHSAPPAAMNDASPQLAATGG